MSNDLSKRAVACKHFRWMPGMRAIVPKNLPMAWGTTRACRIPHSVHPTMVPDLTDPATLGCLLALVREAWGDETVCTAATREADGVRGWVMDAWVPLSPANEIGPYPTEGEVLVAALEAAERQEVSNES